MSARPPGGASRAPPQQRRIMPDHAPEHAPDHGSGPPLVAGRRAVPAVRAVLAGQQRRRVRRPARPAEPARSPVLARRGRHLAVPDDAVAGPGLGLRRQRLPRRAPRARHPGRPGRADQRGGVAGHAGAARPGAQPHQLGAPVVRGRADRQGRGAPRLVRVGLPGRRRRPAEQLARLHRRPGLDLARADRPVLPAQLPARPAGPELVAPAGARGVRADPGVLVRPRGGRVPHRRGPRAVQGRAAAGQPAPGAGWDAAVRGPTACRRSTT